MIYLQPLILSTLAATATAMAADINIRYMPFGDSITDDVCWRFKLWERLQGTEFASVSFVGSSTHDRNCTDTKYDRNHEGHSGFLAVEIAKQNQLEGWLKANPADVITMHLGTNDIVHMTLTSDIIAAYTKLVATMRSCNPRMKIVVAQILPVDLGGAYNAHIQELNAAIPSWAKSLNQTKSPIWVVDQYTGIVSSDLRDGVHPSDSGDEKMMNVWYPALMQAFMAVKAEKSARREIGFEA
ncbi:hypothetical protein HBI56_191010 [Parastagonospora nodorum]|uniref:SGNH hydrolase-type esterase domain-containing protein n=2 Tax=Phaeosphaeria nodorum (strain SN15 / ATCC MYA-4574 / FGSC 10173) TaxID=321614 RepID=Q0U0T8_PHANO|nr:hypothetical protein SNOG_14793 [Parastagonospora nodorum SN15]KAH3908232.1 hypothetical protein HBH56_179440 [Parastagonospora nodorum]EAT77985.1 hypothetical protein SNOG_14793 [Parastagonospora nodorum SN15]KAH3931819.1 hypothetical protein HBH54_090390 [Parastagonospora nodorum]KAH3939290.1 hypothetical protein HBH53_238020 [Parastagonospora nodorum]KAH3956768.1 hypothetical protein HBH51_235350 [Parastagonospora nodorum]